MKRILLTGMSGTGKSTCVQALIKRGYKAIDTDYNGWSHWVDQRTGIPVPSPNPNTYVWDELDWVWNEDKKKALLTEERVEVLVVAGTSINQSKFYPYFDHIILLSAPVEVILQRLENRKNNSYGGTPRSKKRVLEHIETVEPLLRARAHYEIETNRPLEEVIDSIIEILKS